MKNNYFKKVVYLFVISLLLSPLTSFSQGVTALGKFDCGLWLRNPDTKVAARLWAHGYLSGLNAAGPIGSAIKKDFLKNLSSAEQVEVYLYNYCQKNPLKLINEGLIILAIELSAK